uniref:Uncharacterized protein n=1 Tax=Neolamprologus brichardi TaxID=32507 RepID=A0A3Q4GJL9_NEOBR
MSTCYSFISRFKHLVGVGMVSNLHCKKHDNRLIFCVFSLEGRFEDEELQQILDDIQTKRSFQY